MQKKILSLIEIASCVLVFMILFLLTPARLDRGVLSDATATSTVPDYQMEKLRYVSTRGTKAEMELYSTHAVFSHKEQLLDGEQIESYVYYKKNQKTKITGDQGQFDLTAQQLTLEGNVETINPDGFHMQSALLEYDAEKRYAKSPVKVHGFNQEGTIKIWANQADSYLDSTTANFYGDAITYYDAPGQERSKIRGDRAIVKRDSGKIEYYDNVLISEENIKSESRRAELFYASPTKTLKYIVAYDDVKIMQGKGRYTFSQVAEFFAPTDTVVLTGFPSFFDGVDTVNGNRMILHRSTGVVEVSEANAAFNQQQRLEEGPAEAQGRQGDSVSEEDLELLLEE